MYSESPLVLAHPEEGDSTWKLLNEKCSQLSSLSIVWYYAAIHSILSCDPSIISVCLKKFKPDTADNLDDCARVLDALDLSSKIEAKLLHDLLLVWRYNSFQHFSSDYSLVMYNITSFMSHSCHPTCTWVFGEGEEEDKEKSNTFNLRTLRRLNKGDEITISYIGEEELIKPTPMRRKLLQGWLFTCQCLRCSNLDDPLRCVRCPRCFSGALCLSSLRCDTCFEVLSEGSDEVDRFLALEKQYIDRVENIDSSNAADLINVYNEALKLFFETRHYILYRLETHLVALLRESDTLLAVTLLQNRIAYLRMIPIPTYLHAWAMEELADLLLYSVQEPNRVGKAARLYEKSYWKLRFLTGENSNHTRRTQEKWNALMLASNNAISLSSSPAAPALVPNAEL